MERSISEEPFNWPNNVMRIMPMQKTMKSSTNKVVIVKINGQKHEISVDAEIHDDIFIEAATRVVEKYRGNLTFFHKIRIVGDCYEKADEDDVTKHQQINMYHILLNAGFHCIAELLREKTKNLHNVDLSREPARANAGKSGK
jgi:hypothetical protein